MSLQNRISVLVSRFLEGPARQIVIAYSGGVDSHLLLSTVAELTAKYPEHHYLAVHINHGLSPNASHWQQHCQQVCDALNIPLKIQQVQVDASNNGGLEAAARRVRYQAIEALTEHNGLILLGQHIQDQLETVLLQLKRGAGPKGLSAMALTAQNENSVTLARPFLDVEKHEILQLAQQKQLQWIEDESNSDTRFDRNFLRTQVIPTLLNRWPNIAATAHRTAQLCAEQQALLDEVNGQHLQSMINQRFAIHIPKLLSLSVAWQNQIVRFWLAEQNVDMPSQAVLAELPTLLHAKQDANPQISINRHELRRFRDHLYCIKKETFNRSIELTLEKEHTLLPNEQGHLGIAATHIDEFIIRSRNNSQKFKPRDKPHSKPLKQWFKEWDVPVWERDRSLLLYCREQVIAVICDSNIIYASGVSSEVTSVIHFRSNPPKL